jgi:hypothetical protein
VSEAAKKVVEAFDVLSDEEKSSVYRELRERLPETLCQDCGYKLDGQTCWACYSSPLENYP